jgi:hypothetical protein
LSQQAHALVAVAHATGGASVAPAAPAASSGAHAAATLLVSRATRAAVVVHAAAGAEMVDASARGRWQAHAAWQCRPRLERLRPMPQLRCQCAMPPQSVGHLTRRCSRPPSARQSGLFYNVVARAGRQLSARPLGGHSRSDWNKRGGRVGCSASLAGGGRGSRWQNAAVAHARRGFLVAKQRWQQFWLSHVAARGLRSRWQLPAPASVDRWSLGPPRVTAARLVACPVAFGWLVSAGGTRAASNAT